MKKKFKAETLNGMKKKITAIGHAHVEGKSVLAKFVNVREINEHEERLASEFQKFLKIVKDYTTKKDPKEKDFHELKKGIEAYKSYPFAQPLLKRMGESEKELTERGEARSRIADPKFMSGHAQSLAELEKAIESGNWDAAFSQSQELGAMNKALEQSMKSDPSLVSLRNPYEISSGMLFFSGGAREGLLQTFEKSEMDKVINTDLKVNRYTFLPLEEKHLSDFENIVYFIQNLRDVEAPVEIKQRKVKELTQYMQGASAEYQALVVKVNNYLHGNQKKLIPEIIEDMKQFPDLEEANEEAKKDIKVVYRGIPDVQDEEDAGQMTEAEVLEKDKEAKYVATSMTSWSARNFAMQKGHLESEGRSAGGWIIEYKTPIESIVLDTQIFGSIFGEAEVLIDVTKVSDAQIEYFDWAAEKEETEERRREERDFEDDEEDFVEEE